MKPTACIALWLITVSFLTAAPAKSAPASFAYVLQADAFARTKSAAVSQLTTCNRDWIVLDAAFSTDTPWTLTDIDAIRSGRKGRRLIAYISIGEAEDYRSYWCKEWVHDGKLTTAAPSWLGAENPDWKGNYRVNYWQLEWQQIILATVDDVMACGFDGVYLDIVDGFESFEQDGKEYINDRENPETKQTFRRDMVEWVKVIAARARAKNPAALVIPQNGSQLLAQGDFVTAISGIGIEDLFTEGNKLQPKLHTTEVLDTLTPLMAAKKPVLFIEYAKSADRQAFSIKQAQKNGMIWLITDRQLKTLGVSESPFR